MHFPKSELETARYAIEIMAEATDSYDDVKNISGKISVVARNTSSVEWNGTFADEQSETKTPAAYDAYNYTISGTGVGTIKLTYDTDYVVLDKNDKAVFKNISGYLITTTGSKVEITFHVDSTAENAVNYYSIRFYRAGKTDDNGDELVMNSFSETYIDTVFTPDDSDD